MEAGGHRRAISCTFRESEKLRAWLWAMPVGAARRPKGKRPTRSRLRSGWLVGPWRGTPVDAECHAGDVAGAVAEEPRGGFGDFCGLPDSAKSGE
jgi:hypothetical protein